MHDYDRQKTLENNTTSVKNSNRPNNIPADKLHLAVSGKLAKLPAGPITSPMPGPTFIKAVAAGYKIQPGQG
jgi:biotin carboxyl carrier protein